MNSRNRMGGIADLPQSNHEECWCEGQAGVGPIGPVTTARTAPKTGQFYAPWFSSQSQES